MTMNNFEIGDKVLVINQDKIIQGSIKNCSYLGFEVTYDVEFKEKSKSSLIMNIPKNLLVRYNEEIMNSDFREIIIRYLGNTSDKLLLNM